MLLFVSIILLVVTNSIRSHQPVKTDYNNITSWCRLGDRNIMFTEDSNSTINTTSEESSEYVAMFLWIDIFLACLFMIDITVRLVASPSKSKFLRNRYNIVDLICVLPWGVIILASFVANFLGKVGDLEEFEDVFVYMRWLSVLRLIRLITIARHYIAFRIFLITMWESRKAILLLFALYIVGSTMFAVLMHLVEMDHFPTIGSGIWWAIITMSTVGYGDVYPKSELGKSVGALCAFIGLIATALPVAVIANNYNAIYQTAQVKNKIKAKYK